MKTTPRQLFRLRHKEEAAELAHALSQSWFQHTVAFTLAEMAAAGKSQQIVGAAEFLNILESLTEDDVERKSPADPVLKTYEPGWKLPTDVPK